jgi:hypothetical protein
MAENGEDMSPAHSKRQSKLTKMWTEAGLDKTCLAGMVKFALPPTISLCLYQSDTVARVFGSTGYLVAIGSILSAVLAPRAVYIESTVANILLISLTTIITIFASWTVLKARETTTTTGTTVEAYNSSASAVSAIWLFSMIYVINVSCIFICSRVNVILTTSIGAQVHKVILQVCMRHVLHRHNRWFILRAAILQNGRQF